MSATSTGGSVESGRDSSTSLGRWADGDFPGTVSRNRGVGADADLPDHTRFVHRVVRAVLARVAAAEQRGEQDEPDIAIFVLTPSPPDAVKDAKRVPMLHNGLTSVTGRLWFATPAVISARYVELPEGADDDTRFSYVENDLGLGSEPAVIFDSRVTSGRLLWYPEGLGQPEIVEFKPLAGDVTQGDVFAAMDHLYHECFVTPSGLPQQVNLWNNTNQHWPRDDAEALIQSHLKAGLALRFPYCTIRHEQTQQAGRTDLEIEEYTSNDRSSVVYHGILELKVLRSFRRSGGKVAPSEVRGAIADGVSQAGSYRDVKGARWSALCCYDMRQHDAGDEACFDHVQESAATSRVDLKRWFLYASPAEYRKAVAP